jgi:peptidoglycan hydrolase CwlO-like protein
MTGSDIFSIILSCFGALAGIFAAIAYFTNRGKDNRHEGEHDGEIKGDIKYMRNSFDDLRLDVKEVARKQDSQSERITRVEESVKQAHKRIDTLESKNKE